MYQFIESVCIRNGKAQLLPLHQERVNRTFKSYYSENKPIILDQVISNIPAGRLVKCRILYSAVNCSVEFIDYKIPKINSLRIVEGKNVEYKFKSLDRKELSTLFAQREECDDVLIVKNQKITDSYFANCVFFDGKRWLTPENPLLSGVKRQELISKEVIVPMEISVRELPNFEKISLINAMLDLHDVEVLTACIKL